MADTVGRSLQALVNRYISPSSSSSSESLPVPDERDIKALCDKAIDILMLESNVVNVSSPAVVP